MTTPITKQKKSKPIPAVTQRREWCCGTPVTEPHVPGCAYEPGPDGPVDYTTPAEVAAPPAPQSVLEPPPAPPVEVPAAAQPRSYGFKRHDEFDLELPSGGFVRYRKMTPGQVLQLNMIEVLDGFSPELLADVKSGDGEKVGEAFLKALADPERNAKIFGPAERVTVAAVIIPKVVMDGPTTDTQVNVKDIDPDDKLAIFAAAVGEQLGALKSVRDESTPGV